MELWIALVAGVIVGWIIEWVIDWLYWRRNLAEFYANEERLREDLDLAQMRAGDAQATLTRIRSDMQEMRLRFDGLVKSEAEAKQQVQALQEKLQTAADVEAQLRAELASAQHTSAQHVAASAAAGGVLAAMRAPETGVEPIHGRDDLERINGVGRTYEQKLFDAGIDTYAKLAAASDEQLRDIIQPQAWQNVDFASWTAQARQFAEVVLEDMLPYRLEAIRGIGPTYVKRLNAAGIRTFDDLAAASEGDLTAIIKPASWQNVDFSSWIGQAKKFAALVAGDRPPLPLERIKGIGPVFATKLDMAGVRTFDDLASLSEDALKHIIGARAWRAVDYESWIAQAREFAAADSAAEEEG